MYFNFSSSDIANSSTNLARKKSAKASRNFSSAYKISYMLCKTMVFLAIFRKKKRRTPLCLGHSPLRQDKDNTFSFEIQISLTYRNNFRNVKRRVLHTRGFAMCYITRAGGNETFSFQFQRTLCSLVSAEACGFLVSVGDCVPWFQRSLTAASSIVWCAISRFYQLVSMKGRFSIQGNYSGGFFGHQTTRVVTLGVGSNVKVTRLDLCE